MHARHAPDIVYSRTTGSTDEIFRFCSWKMTEIQTDAIAFCFLVDILETIAVACIFLSVSMTKKCAFNQSNFEMFSIKCKIISTSIWSYRYGSMRQTY